MITRMQARRLAAESAILKKYFPKFEWYQSGDAVMVEGMITTSSGNCYMLRVYVPHDYPNSAPDMVVTDPCPLIGHHGEDLRTYGADSRLHLLNARYGNVRICHCAFWLPSSTLYKVLLKGRIWLEAYESHRATGLPVAQFLSDHI